MVMERSVAVIVGSLRKGSFSRRVAHALIANAPDGLTFRMVEIGALPHFDQDVDAEGRTFEAWRSFRDAIRGVEAVLFVTPEYNRSMPGVLKNAIDVGSRPYGQSVWALKPAAIVSVTPGAMGGFGANHALRQSLVFLDMPTLQQPEAYIGHADTRFSPDGGVDDADTRDFLAKFMKRFSAWIETVHE